jgi:ankyrin repeat protein
VLLQNGADIVAADRYGRTVLSWAAENKHAAVVQLLKMGAESQ